MTHGNRNILWTIMTHGRSFFLLRAIMTHVNSEKWWGKSWLMNNHDSRKSIFFYEKSWFFVMILWPKTWLFWDIFLAGKNIFPGRFLGPKNIFPGWSQDHSGIIQGSSRHHFKLILCDCWSCFEHFLVEKKWNREISRRSFLDQWHLCSIVLK